MKTPSLILVIAFLASLHSTAARAASVWAWGDQFYGNRYGELNVPTNLTDVIAISAGSFHSVALLSDRSVVAWGDNSAGQTNVPADLKSVVAISAGSQHNLALQVDGRVVAWGYNGGGECNVPANLVQVIAVSAGAWHSLALRADGTVVAWGENYYGQTTVPPDVTNAVAIFAGGHSSGAFLANGTIKIWGGAPIGSPPVLPLNPPPADLTNVVAVSVGLYHALALLSNGTIRAFGYGLYGETNVPPDLTNAVAVSAGAYESLALKSDGTVVAFGWNTNWSQPAGLFGATAISAGGQNFNLALAHVPQPQVIINFVGPLSQTVGAGSGAFFSVSASGAAPLAYQWYSGTNALPGMTNQWLALNGVQVSQAGTYTVIVSNSRGSATSQPLTLNVDMALKMSSGQNCFLSSFSWSIAYFAEWPVEWAGAALTTVDHADIRESTQPGDYPDCSYHQTTVRVAALPLSLYEDQSKTAS